MRSCLGRFLLPLHFQSRMSPLSPLFPWPKHIATGQSLGTGEEPDPDGLPETLTISQALGPPRRFSTWHKDSAHSASWPLTDKGLWPSQGTDPPVVFLWYSCTPTHMDTFMPHRCIRSPIPTYIHTIQLCSHSHPLTLSYLYHTHTHHLH